MKNKDRENATYEAPRIEFENVIADIIMCSGNKSAKSQGQFMQGKCECIHNKQNAHDSTNCCIIDE